MNFNKKDIKILFLKDNASNWIPATSQTKNLRNNTNQNIRILGNKYFQVKSLFDRLNLQRDQLFNLGRELEQQYKDQKNITHLQTSSKRIKDLIVCWFSSNFYDEIFTPGSPILNQIIMLSQINKSSGQIKLMKNTPLNNKNVHRKDLKVIKETRYAGQINNVNINGPPKSEMHSVYQELKMNEEIDSYQYGDEINQENITNSNFIINQDMMEIFKFK